MNPPRFPDTLRLASAKDCLPASFPRWRESMASPLLTSKGFLSAKDAKHAKKAKQKMLLIPFAPFASFADKIALLYFSMPQTRAIPACAGMTHAECAP